VRNLEKAFELDPANSKIVNGLSVAYDLLRRYDDESALFDRAANANPSTRNYCQMVHAQIETQRGDLKAAHSFLNSLPADYDPDGQTTWTRLTLALYERDPDLAARILGAYKNEELVGGHGKLVPVSYWEGVIARARGDGTKAREVFARARATIETRLADGRDDPILLATLGLVDAGLSRKEEALREGRHAAELRPLSDDAVDGATVLNFLAMIYAWTGELNSAVEQLTALAKIPNGPYFGELKYDPAWDAVRGDPRFTAMLNELQPRVKQTR
jgi:tetratricopeptide (TPR) repeat protein